MITVTLLGGLGNQLHALAAGIASAGHFRVPLRIDCSEIAMGSNPKRRFSLSEFPFSAIELETEIVGRDEPSLATRFGFNLGKLMTKLDARERKFYQDSSESPQIQLAGMSRNSILKGHFLNFEWAEKAQSFGFPRELKYEKLERYSLVQQVSPNFIAIHIRLGDYLNLRKMFPEIPADYFHKALASLDPGGDLPRILFTDDISSVKSSYGSVLKQVTEIYSSPKKSSAWGDLVAMSQAKALITSNSTFSTWAGWFNSSVTKEVWSPIPHLATGWKDYLPKRWIRYDLFSHQIVGTL